MGIFRSDKSLYQQRAEGWRDQERRAKDERERRRARLEAEQYEKLERQRRQQERK